MKLEKKYKQNNREYYCELTKELDEICGYTTNYPRYKHYIYDTRDLWNNCLAIRVPGKTVGNIRLNKNSVIIQISLSTDLIGDDHCYPINIYKEMEKYIGLIVEL